VLHQDEQGRVAVPVVTRQLTTEPRLLLADGPPFALTALWEVLEGRNFSPG
jgi:hypothetical protein